MIVERFTWKVKPGYGDQFVELIKAEATKSLTSNKWRLYTPNIRGFDVIACEFEFENLAALEKYWDEWYARPETAEFWKKFDEYRESGGGSEIWNLVEA